MFEGGGSSGKSDDACVTYCYGCLMDLNIQLSSANPKVALKIDLVCFRLLVVEAGEVEDD